ncbi:MAG TPA: aromatic-ring-hydroxylating dioxygenase subunit beta [Caulobacteraceae bacterium]|jgi:3-phenylpropionate/cinnamic acid dioxygenase small subunit|nr:aromatic-ring-hydroxylating dioxygenase subunit beta [Caulobacteraceae bacterium]
MDPALFTQLEVQQWLVAEARLLDARRYDLWLQLLDPGVRYRVPDRSYRLQDDVRDFATWSVDRELEGEAGLALIDEDHAGLQLRIGRLRTTMGWAEMPASMSRRLVGNVVVDGAEDAEDCLSVVSTLFLAKVRREERVLFTAERRDRLVQTKDGYRLRARYVVLDDVVLPSENLSLLF